MKETFSLIELCVQHLLLWSTVDPQEGENKALVNRQTTTRGSFRAGPQTHSSLANQDETWSSRWSNVGAAVGVKLCINKIPSSSYRKRKNRDGKKVLKTYRQPPTTSDRSKPRSYANLHREGREVNKQLSDELFYMIVIFCFRAPRDPLTAAAPRRALVLKKEAAEQMGLQRKSLFIQSLS